MIVGAQSGQRGGAAVSTVAFDSRLGQGLTLWTLHVPPAVSGFLPQSNEMHVRLMTWRRVSDDR